MKGYMSCTLNEKIYRMRKPKLCEVIGGPKQRFTVKELYVGDAFLQCYGLSKWVWLRLEIKQNHWSILKRCCILYQFTADVQTYSQQQSSRGWRVCSKMLGCCLNNKESEILFRINILPPLTIVGLDGEGPWFGLPGHRTAHQWTSSHGPTFKPWFICWQLILKTILLPVSLSSSNHQATTWYFWAHTSVSAASLLALYQGWWPNVEHLL
jgi:hypothetical protein